MSRLREWLARVGGFIRRRSAEPDLDDELRFHLAMTEEQLRKSGMLQLGKMLEEIEQQQLPISISRLNIRRRGGERARMAAPVMKGLTTRRAGDSATRTRRPGRPVP